MLWEDNVLAHYGISGQRWGIRRFQNLDGSLTDEGRKRYLPPRDRKGLHRVFKSTEADILKRLSNSPKKVTRKPVNLEEVKRRGELNDKEAIECGALAGKIFDNASKVEPKITKDVISAVTDSGSNMYGLEYRLKQPTSIAAKIGSDAKEDGVSFKDAAGAITDAIRYTSVSDDNRYTDNYFKVKDLLSGKGYREVRCKNFFEMYENGKVSHKAVQCLYEDSDGNKFELQFHTPSSQSAKELKLPIYNERRKSDLSDQRKAELEKQMIDLAEQVANPRNVMDIKAHN